MSTARAALLLVAGTIVTISGLVHVFSSAGTVWLGVILLLSALPPLAVGARELQRRNSS